ncbi:hypothetical protein EMIHUDRAFT_117274 [Emiliania huxleyi CCMP1516]|uniref:AP2/ERF domain-containing protein n=2 Tax=Emiliania huxleyi TaxID=2903 RepID=A0A0D3JCP4_EMIH1|nr:hypothetical protein EMIHUDRAFT_117274 [Emiliania huxleyi CCMP1516]EOD21279.1 hypothetical protein EMIHUDRAFT_117274 [Emiliania huxleyi CCMP1516]|eukprot:XP_005773708.1 hypothetical protein EMIHUDRAFT_117274 [Emiliania huxleyi CCMP1516]
MARANSSRATATERLVLIPAIYKRNTTGYKNVTFNSSNKKFVAQVRDGGKRVYLGSFDTAEEAAVAYARSEYGRADAAKLLQPRAAPTAADAEVIRQAEREGLTLVTSGSSNSGYKGVCYCPKRKGSKKYELAVRVGGKQVFLGMFATAEQAALFYARREAGRDTSDLTAPSPPPPPPAPSTAAGEEAVRQAEREGLTLATSSGSNSGYKGVIFYPKLRGSKKYMLQVTVGGRKITLGYFATAEDAALFRARSMAATRQRLGGLPPAFKRWQRQQRQQRVAQAESEGEEEESETEEEESETEEEESESEAEEEEAFGPAAASAAQAAPSAATRLQRSSQRKRPAEACSTDAEVAELGLALARSENQMPPDEREQRAAKRRRLLEQEEDAAAAATAEEAEEAGGTAEPDSPQPAHLSPVPPPPPPPQLAPWLEAGARCSICLEGSDVDDERLLTRALFCDPFADDGWGYSLCCHNIFHYTCLLAQTKPRQADYVTRQGQCDIATDCPSCRSEIYGTRRRMLNRGPQGGEPPRRNESLRAQRARKGF